MSALSRCYSIDDLRRVAKRRLPKGVFDYIDLGTEEGIAMRENREAFHRLRLNTRFMVDLRERDLGTTVFGQRLNLPLGIAPVGVAGLCWHDAEIALAKAAANAGIPFTVAHPSLTPLERIAEVGGNLWFQIYMWDEVDYCYELIDKAAELDYQALVVTVDSALGRLREHNERNGFAFPFKPNARAINDMLRHPRWLTSVLFKSILTSGVPRNSLYPPKYQRMIAWRQSAPKPKRFEGMTWEEVARIREMWPRTLIVKSVLSGEDARLAVDHGADGVIVSNHGGRSMDSAVATIDVLPEVVKEVGSRATVILDSGIRRGSDVIKALALGADMAMVGRATAYGVSAGGQAGAEKAIEIIGSEYEKTMGYLGCRSVDELGPHIFAQTPQR